MSTSSINFEAASSNSELRRAVETLKNWLERHEGISFFTFDQLRRDLANSVPADEFNRVIGRLVAAGELSVKYRVKIKEDEYSEQDFASPDEVDSVVFDSAFEPVLTENKEIVPAYAPAR